jgi:hypothetical protein
MPNSWPRPLKIWFGCIDPTQRGKIRLFFPRGKKILTPEQLREMNEKFEDIEHEMFGEDGFEKAVMQISEIETELGMADLSQFTAPPVF